jgi:hypothetical protein
MCTLVAATVVTTQNHSKAAAAVCVYLAKLLDDVPINAVSPLTLQVDSQY